MILKALTLENFKGIREPVRIECSPLTLLFGPNNAGKSTILHALIYAREIFERGNIDPRRTEMGGDIIDLGGFDGMVYCNDRSRTIRMRFEFDVTADELLKAVDVDADAEAAELQWIHKEIEFCKKPNLRETIDALQVKWLEMRISWNFMQHQPVIIDCCVGGGEANQEFVKIARNPQSEAIEIKKIDLGRLLLGTKHNKKSRKKERKILTKKPVARYDDEGKNFCAKIFFDNGYYEYEYDPSVEEEAMCIFYKKWSEKLSIHNKTFQIPLEDFLYTIPTTLLDRDNPGESYSNSYECYCDEEERERYPQNVSYRYSLKTNFLSFLEKFSEVESLSQPCFLDAENFLRSLILNSFFAEGKKINPILIEKETSVLLKKNRIYFGWSPLIQDEKFRKLIKQGIRLKCIMENHGISDYTCSDPDSEISSWLNPQEIIHHFLEPLIESISVGFIDRCRQFLSTSLYLSSIRMVPPRDFHPVEPIDSRRWPSGLAAWDLISSLTNEDLRTALNDWLNDEPNHFASGYRIEIQRLKELDLADPLIARIIANEPDITMDALRERIERLPEKRKLCVRNIQSSVLTAPQDIGYGVSQLLPVIVAALNTKNGIVAIEEPESNIHPAFQVMLADLFITQAKANPSVLFLIETHSEHLMLRCLRRIRETQQDALAEDAPPVLPDDIAVNFIEPSDQGPRIHRIRIDEDGDFADPWPLGFFPERFKELYGDDL